MFFLLLLKKSCEIIISDLKQIKRIIIRKLLKLLFCIDYAKTVRQIFFLFLRGGKGGGKKVLIYIINKSAHKSTN